MGRCHMKLSPMICALALGFAVSALPVRADDVKTYEVTLKADVFTPAEITVPKGTAFMIKLINANDAPAELEAKQLKVEKVAPGKSDVTVRVRAMEPGKYLFVDEFQEDTAKGYVIVE